MSQQDELERLLAEEEALLAELQQQSAGQGQSSGVGAALRRAGGYLVDEAGRQLGNTGTHYRQLYRGADALLGDVLPDVAPPTPEARESYEDSVIEGGAMMLGGGATGLASKGLQAAGRGFLRGGTKHGTRRFLKDNAQHVVPDGAPATASIAYQMARPVAIGVGTERVIDWSDPATSEFWDSMVSLPLGIVAGGVAATEGRATLLLQNPRFRAAAMKASRAGVPSKIIGGLAGYFLLHAFDRDEDEAAVPTEQDALARALLGDQP